MRKQNILIMVLLTILNLNLNLNLKSQVAVNTSGNAADASAMLDVSSTDKGILIPRMTLAKRDLIDSPVPGLLIYQTDNTPGFYFYDGSAWVVVGDGATSINSLYDGKTGGHSVFLGNNSGTVDDGSDNWNTGIGEGVLPVNTAGSYNTVVGDRGMQSNETGWNNTAIGHKALYSNVLGNGNIAIGFEAGYNETGSNKLYIDNSNTDNPLIYGDFSTNLLRINGTIDINNAYQLPTTDGTVGQTFKTDGSGSLVWSDNGGATSLNDLSDAATDNNSLFLGIDAGVNNANNYNFNTGVGVWSLKDVTSGSHNSALGTTALQQLTTGSQNTTFGMGALNSITTNSNNTAIGKEAGKDVTGSGNIFIGNEAAKTQTNISNKLFIDNSDTDAPLIYGDFENDNATINGTLNVKGATAINTDGSEPDESAILDLKSTNKGFLPPRMTTVERNAISSPEEGLVIYNSDFKSLELFNGTLWKSPIAEFVCGDQVVDADSNIYNTVKIGSQCWMAENLNVGTRIDVSIYQTNNSTIEKYCYNNDTANCTTYGGLYQWDEMMQYTTTQGVQGICPYGWHLPTTGEWTDLTDYLGGYSVAGGKMKSTSGWDNNGNGTNESGFTGLPGGWQLGSNGSFKHLGSYGLWWNSTEFYTDALYLFLYSGDNQLGSGNTGEDYGFSVRCLKN